MAKTMNHSMNNTRSTLSETEFVEYKVSVVIWKTVPLVLLLVGSVGNILSILVLMRKQLRRSNISLLLVILALADIVALYMGLLPRWILKISDVRLSTDACKFLMFITYFSVDVSAWTLVSITIYRALSVWVPQKLLSCNMRKLAIVPVITIASMFAINAHILYGMDRIEGKAADNLVCLPNEPDYLDFYLTIWPWIDLGVFCVAPFAILLGTNASIILKVIKSREKVNANQTATGGQNAQKANRNKTTSMTKTIILLNSVFLLTTSPISVYVIGLSHWSITTPHDKAKHKLVWAFLMNLVYANNVLNFFIYCLSGTVFRTELIALFRKEKSSRVNTSERQA